MKKHLAMFLTICFVFLTCLPVAYATSAEPSMLSDDSAESAHYSVNDGVAVAYVEGQHNFISLKDGTLYLGEWNSDEEPIPIVEGIGCLQKTRYSEFVAWGISPCNILEPELIPTWLSIGMMAGDITVLFGTDGMVYLNGIEVAYYQKVPSIYSYVWESRNHLVFGCSEADWTWIEGIPVNREQIEFDVPPASEVDEFEGWEAVESSEDFGCSPEDFWDPIPEG